MASNVTFGDAEAAVIDIVRADAAIIAVSGVTVTTNLVGFRAGARWVQVQRTGGMPTLWMQVDNAVISVDVRADRKSAALDLAEAARAAVFAARASYIGHGLRLYDVVDSVGMTWAPDVKMPDVARYTFALSLVTRPA